MRVDKSMVSSNAHFVLIAGMMLAGLSLSFGRAYAATTNEAKVIDALIEEVAAEEGIRPLLLKAICLTESDLNPSRYEHNDGGEGNHAFGLCQVLRTTAEGYVGRDPGCLRDFSRGQNLRRTPANCKLFDPRLNLRVAARYLKMQLKRYEGDETKATAAYNAGSVRVCKSGVVLNKARRVIAKCTRGGLLNEFYVDRVDRWHDYVVVESSGEGMAVPFSTGTTGGL